MSTPRVTFEELPPTITDLAGRVWHCEQDPSGAILWVCAGTWLYASPDWEGTDGVSFEMEFEEGYPIPFDLPWTAGGSVLIPDRQRYLVIIRRVLSLINIFTAAQWDGLATAVDIAYEDESCVPEALQPVANDLMEIFRPGSTTPPNPVPTAPVKPEPTFRVTIGGMSVPFFPFPQWGSFLGVAAHSSAGNDVLYSVAIDQDNGPLLLGGEPELVEVTNAEGISLPELNSFFGTAFTPHDFPGR